MWRVFTIGSLIEEARAAADDELEAAEALAELARCSFQDRTIAVQHTTAAPAMTDQTVSDVPTAGFQSNSLTKSKQCLNEADKEARRIRRILANRESARQTIHRRRAMLLELTSKEAELSEENENLKKKNELALKEYNTLKTRNKFLKEQMAKIKHKEPMLSSQSSSSTNYLNEQPPLVPCFWPSDVFQFQCATQPRPQQILIPNRDIVQDYSTGNTRPPTPLFVFQVPWMLPFIPHSSTTFHSHGMQNENLTNHYITSHHHPGSTVYVPRPQNSVEPLESPGPAANFQLNYNNQEPIINLNKSSEDVAAETEARRKRKEVMKLKNIHGHHFPTHH